MTYLHEAISRLEEHLDGSGCEDATVCLRVEDGSDRCQYGRGHCLVAVMGGRSGRVMTTHTLQATTRVSYMFGAPLERPEQRAAAVAIINAVCAFLCLSRRTRPCDTGCHGPCLSALRKRIAGRRVWFPDSIPVLEAVFADQKVDSPGEADLILAGGPAFTDDAEIAVIDRYRETVDIIFLGPDGAGLPALLGFEQHCPYGR
ncbi:MAG: hypothetical protein ACXQTG_01590 [Methanoculleaceae archaeon]